MGRHAVTESGRSRLVSVGGLELHVLEWGDPKSPAVLLLHGGSANAHWWDFFSPRLADRYHLLALDLRGHGDSAWDESAEYGITAHVGDVRTLVEMLAPEGLAIIGHSFGGLVATAYAASAESRAAALVLVDSRLKVGERAARVMSSLEKLPQPVYPTVEDAVRRFRLLPAASTAPEEVLLHVTINAIHRLDDGSWTLKFDRRTLAGTDACDLSAELPSVRCPVLLVRGGASDFVSAEMVASWARLAPNARAVEIADAHHHVMLDQPEALARAVREFLSARMLAAEPERV
jgi:pimeloyl-ACP methyl ester carboxylesterase